MKSLERQEKEREKRTMLLGLLAMAFVFMVACALMILSFTGGQDSVGDTLNIIMINLKEIAAGIWFKISNFLGFLTRGLA